MNVKTSTLLVQDRSHFHYFFLDFNKKVCDNEYYNSKKKYPEASSKPFIIKGKVTVTTYNQCKNIEHCFFIRPIPGAKNTGKNTGKNNWENIYPGNTWGNRGTEREMYGLGIFNGGGN